MSKPFTVQCLQELADDLSKHGMGACAAIVRSSYDYIKEMEAVIRHHAVVQQQLRAELAKRDARVALLEEALKALLDANTLEGTANNLTEAHWAAVVTQAVAALEDKP